MYVILCSDYLFQFLKFIVNYWEVVNIGRYCFERIHLMLSQKATLG